MVLGTSASSLGVGEDSDGQNDEGGSSDSSVSSSSGTRGLSDDGVLGESPVLVGVALGGGSFGSSGFGRGSFLGESSSGVGRGRVRLGFLGRSGVLGSSGISGLAAARSSVSGVSGSSGVSRVGVLGPGLSPSFVGFGIIIVREGSGDNVGINDVDHESGGSEGGDIVRRARRRGRARRRVSGSSQSGGHSFLAALGLRVDDGVVNGSLVLVIGSVVRLSDESGLNAFDFEGIFNSGGVLRVDGDWAGFLVPDGEDFRGLSNGALGQGDLSGLCINVGTMLR